MTPDQIKTLVIRELKNDFIAAQLRGVDLARCIVEPALAIFEDARDPEKTHQLFIVFKEIPDSEEGFHIVCDVNACEFGLTIKGKGLHRVFLGFDGSFRDAFEGM